MEELKNQISAYLDRQLSQKEIEAFEKGLEKYAALREELAEMQLLRQKMDLMTVPQFNEQKVKANFYAMLERETEAKVQTKATIWEKLIGNWNLSFANWGVKVAYSLVLLVLGVAGGYFFSPSKNYDEQMSQLSSEVQSMKEMMMLTLLEQKSPSERLKAVSLTNELDDVNDKVINALLQTLDNDENMNVRLAAVEALYNFKENPKAREGLIKSVSKQESPLLQLALVEVIIALQDKKNLPVLQELIKKKDLNESVKTKAENGIEFLQL
ncbi:MAG: HEAT repeat domain-containing protein [Cytophagales bacterium]|nr:MAG: HEAT repeat domain-containing protein [Cytophagales bacterium]